MNISVKIKSISNLQDGTKQDGSKWYARNLVLVANDGSMYPDEFTVRITGDFAQNCKLRENEAYEADISFSVRSYNNRIYQETYLRNLGLSPDLTATPSPNLGGEEEKPF